MVASWPWQKVPSLESSICILARNNLTSIGEEQSLNHSKAFKCYFYLCELRPRVFNFETLEWMFRFTTWLLKLLTESVDWPSTEPFFAALQPAMTSDLMCCRSWNTAWCAKFGYTRIKLFHNKIDNIWMIDWNSFGAVALLPITVFEVNVCVANNSLSHVFNVLFAMFCSPRTCNRSN